MDNTILGKTTLEQMPPEFRHGEHPHARKPWAIIIILIVIILFGAFWVIRKNAISENEPASPTAVESPYREDLSSIVELQDALANVTIDGYEDIF